MSIDSLKDALPDYAKDLKQNLTMVMTTAGLTPQQLWGTAVASAIASRNATVLNAVLAEATPNLSPEALTAAKAAAAIMGMTNVYYRFLHLTTVPDYASMPPRLRMSVIGSPGVDKVDFELWSLAVSAINGCGLCVDTHEKEIVKHGTGRDVIQNAVRIASVIHAVAVTLETEAAIKG